MSIRLLVCDDHEVIRTGLTSLLAGTDIQIVGEAATGKDALRLAQKDKPDVILIGYSHARRRWAIHAGEIEGQSAGM